MKNMQSRISKLSAVMLLAGLLCGATVLAQNNGTPAGGKGTAGTQEVFRFGVGARAQGLGSAVVAMPLDATTIYWNPGGLDYLERRNVVMYYSPLLPGTDAKYHFIGAAYPILNVGTVGFGWLHYDVGDIPLREAGSGADLGTSTSGEDEFFLSFSRQISYGVALGGNFKIKRQQLIEATTRAFGADLGLLYRPEFGEGILENLSFGVSMLNAIRPSLKLVGYSEARPRIIRAGLAKSLYFGARPNQANLFLALEKPEGQSEKMRYNFGAEYVYQNLGMLRVGFNGAEPMFGGGVLYQNKFQIDYAFGKFDKNDFGIGAIHRVSITAHLGKTKTQLRDDAQARVLRKIEEETRNKEAMNRRGEFDEKMTLGKNYFQRGEYFSAFINFTQARDISAGAYATFSPQDKEDANIWVERTKTKMDDEAQVEKERLAQAEREKTLAAADRDFVDGQTKKGMQYLQAGKFNEAIAEWKRGLERDANNSQLQGLIAKTEGEIRNRRGDLLKRARGFESSGQVGDAINLYTQLMNQPDLSAADLKSYQDKVAQLQKQMNAQELFRKGYTEYLNRNYCVAKGFFSQALQVDANNATLRKHHYDADVRCNARVGPIPDAIRQRYLEAIGLLNNDDYAAALRILEEIQPQDRYNQRILSAIDQARAGLQKSQK